MDPEQTAHGSSLILVHTVCHRGFLNRREKQTTFAAIGALRVGLNIFYLYTLYIEQEILIASFPGASY